MSAEGEQDADGRDVKEQSRREFLKRTGVATAGAASLMASGNFAYAGGSDKLKIGIVGCGGRGTGAVKNCVDSSEGIELWAMGDLFEDRLERSKKLLEGAIGDSYNVGDRDFIGFDAYKQVLDTEIDLVLLAAPPAFRPHHMKEAIAAGKHVFAEKPVAVDPAGVQMVRDAADRAEENGLAIVAGTQRRHHPGYVEAMKRLHEGAIGDVRSAQVWYNAAGFRDARERKPGMSDMEWQARNWYYFNWLSGDHIVEQAVHRIDIMNWALESHPVKATGLGGRQVRVDPSYGHIFDHFAVEYQFPDGEHVTHMSSQLEGSTWRVGEHFSGTKGHAKTSDRTIKIRGTNDWTFDENAPNPYVKEHADLIASVRAGEPLNEGRRIAESVLTGIMGREAAYTGKEITWEEIDDPSIDLAPQPTRFHSLPVPPVPEPGRTKLDRRAWGSDS
jgi:predicted dehydrogenase